MYSSECSRVFYSNLAYFNLGLLWLESILEQSREYSGVVTKVFDGAFKIVFWNLLQSMQESI